MRIFNETNVWSSVAALIVGATLLPVIFIALGVLPAPTENWQHIKDYLLTDYAVTTLVLFVFSGLGASCLGVSLAYLVTVFDFPGRRFFQWALILPLAIPAYIGAYTYGAMFSFTGIFTRLLSGWFGFPVSIDIMSLPGAVFIFTFFLFPYVYVISRGFLAKYTAPLIESSIMLGKNYTEVFFQVILPVSRGVIASGAALILMEVANDYGVASYFGINTFSIAIFKVWFGMGDVGAAARLSLYALSLIVLIILGEKALRGQKRFGIAQNKIRLLSAHRLKKRKALLASAYCLFVFSLGFLVPFLQLFAWALWTYDEVLEPGFVQATLNTMGIALLCAMIIVCCASVITNSARITRYRGIRLLGKFTAVGYSAPGAVIAIGILLLFMQLNKISETLANYSLITSVYMLLFAYVVRFMAVGCNALENGFEKIGKTYFEASRTLGFGITQTFFRVDFKMMRPVYVGAFSLLFVDIVKELPLTLILRPFNFHTLATKVHEYAHDERIHHSAPAALIIIAICCFSAYTLSRIEKE